MKHPVRLAALAVAAALAVGAAVTVLAAGQGSQDDPLLTLSYLEEVIAPQLQEKVDAAVKDHSDELQKQLDIAITSYETRVDEALAAAGTHSFQTRELAKGERAAPGAGRELLVVSGELTAQGRLADTTAGASVSAGDKLEPGHLYVALDAGSGCVAAGAATVMSR